MAQKLLESPRTSDLNHDTIGCCKQVKWAGPSLLVFRQVLQSKSHQNSVLTICCSICGLTALITLKKIPVFSNIARPCNLAGGTSTGCEPSTFNHSTPTTLRHPALPASSFMPHIPSFVRTAYSPLLMRIPVIRTGSRRWSEGSGLSREKRAPTSVSLSVYVPSTISVHRKRQCLHLYPQALGLAFSHLLCNWNLCFSCPPLHSLSSPCHLRRPPQIYDFRFDCIAAYDAQEYSGTGPRTSPVWGPENALNAQALVKNSR